MHVNGADFLLTFKCPSQCKHCSYKAGPERNGVMDLEDAERWLSEQAGECQLPYWLGGTLESPESIEIDNEGNVTLAMR